jgi:hypothetical protein
MSLDDLRLAALLHDIGKPQCWSRGGRWSEHIYDTYDIVKQLLGEETAVKAMRHHTGSSYEEKYHPRNEDEWIIWLSDKLSSGLDRKEEAQDYSWKPAPPFILSHPLSQGDKYLHTTGSLPLRVSSKQLSASMKENLNESDRYISIYDTLKTSFLREIPADTRSPINDVSLWMHSKLTAAISTCIYHDGGWKGAEPKKYMFSMLSGDGDRISRYIGESRRLPDLNARSQMVTTATMEASKVVEETVGPECVIYAGGGSLLALVPVSYTERLRRECAEKFHEAMKGCCTMTLSSVEAPGDLLLKNFGEVWKKASNRLRQNKLDKPVYLNLIPSDVALCDVCKVKEAVYEDTERILPVNASPRHEMLCKECWEARQSGRGVWIQSLEDEAGFIAFIKADGDSMGEALSGKTFQELGKATTPGRLSTLSNLIHNSCENALRKVVRSYDGVVVYAGGDDLLAILPGEKSLDAAIDISHSFREAMNGKLTMSAGVSLCPRRLPVYRALRRTYELIGESKKAHGKNSVSFSFVNGLGVESPPVEPMSWMELDEILGVLSYLENSDIKESQLRRLAVTSEKSPVEAEALVQYLMGREVIEWEMGKRLLDLVHEGRLGDAFILHKLFKVDEDE